MDRSFLSQPEVIAAARDFVCVRLTTYENEAEGAFLKSFNVTRSGELENTVFTILAADGKKQLVRASRSIRQSFRDAADMAATMKRIVGESPSKATARDELPALPLVANVRLAVDVAACDGLPLAVIHAPDELTRQRVREQLAALVWSDEFVGRFIYVEASAETEL